MKYKIYVQDNLIDTLDAENTIEVLRFIGIKLSQKQPPYDNIQNNSIKIEPSDE